MSYYAVVQLQISAFDIEADVELCLKSPIDKSAYVAERR
jgi:hypothetical protein